MITGVLTDYNSRQLEATAHLGKLPSIERSPPIEEVINTGVVPCFVEFLVRKDFPQLQLTSVPGVFMSVLTNDNRLQLEATTHFRKLPSKERSPPIEEVTNTNEVPHLVEFLVRENFSQLQFDAAHGLTNNSSGTLMLTKVVWSLGNVAGDSLSCHDLDLPNAVLLHLSAQLNEHANLSMLKNATWTLPNFYRAKAQPPFDQVKPLPALERLIHSNDKEVLTDASWALPYLSDGTNDKIQPVIEAEVCARLVELLGHPSPAVFISALPTGGNIVTGNDMQTQGGSASDETKLIKIGLAIKGFKRHLKKNWPYFADLETPKRAWIREWNVHGKTQRMFQQKQYFEVALKFHEEVTDQIAETLGALRSESSQNGLAAEVVLNRLTDMIGSRPQIVCLAHKGVYYLTQVNVYYDKTLSRKDCGVYPYKLGDRRNRSQAILYPLKT